MPGEITVEELIEEVYAQAECGTWRKGRPTMRARMKPALDVLAGLVDRDLATALEWFRAERCRTGRRRQGLLRLHQEHYGLTDAWRLPPGGVNARVTGIVMDQSWQKEIDRLWRRWTWIHRIVENLTKLEEKGMPD